MEEISNHWWDLGDGVADGDWENGVRSQGAYVEGDWGFLSYVQCSLYFASSLINVYFSYYMAGDYGQTLYTAEFLQGWFADLWFSPF